MSVHDWFKTTVSPLFRDISDNKLPNLVGRTDVWWASELPTSGPLAPSHPFVAIDPSRESLSSIIQATSYNLTPDTTTVSENAGNITFTITRSGSFPAETIYASTLTDTASSAGGDYNGLINQAVNFNSGQTTATFTVHINDDTQVESTEHFRVMIAHNTTDGSAQAIDISDVSITDNDAVPTSYNLTPNTTTVSENVGDITFTVTRSGSFPAETLYAGTLFDTASSSGGDYNGLVNLPINFSAGQTTATFTVHINDDTQVENSEHFRVMIAHNTTDGSGQAIDISDVTITDNDTVPTSYNLTPDTTTVSENAGDITFTITRSGSFPAETIYASTLTDTASSAGGDYNGLVNQAVTFNSGQTTATFTVHINDDTQVESTEHFRVMIAHNTTDSSGQAIDISDVSITDNDAVPTSYNLAPDTTTVAENAGDITFTVTRSGSFPAETLYAGTLFDTASSADGDYNGLVNLPINFSAGQTTATFTVHINDDTQAENSEHFRVMIAHNTTDGSGQAIDISDVNITDNDAVPTSYNLTPNTTTVSENAGDLTFTVTRSGSFPAETLYAGTLFDTASSADGDYNGLVNLPINFSAGQTTATFTVHINDDTQAENSEHFRVMIAHNTTDGPSQAIDISDVNITDNDSASTDSVPENVGTASTLALGSNRGTIDQNDISGDTIDHDWFKVNLAAGHSYHFSAQGVSGSLDAVAIDLRDASGNKVTPVYDGSNPGFDYTPNSSGTFYVAISAGGNGDYAGKTGDYQINFADGGATNYAITPSPKDVSEGVGSFTFTITRADASQATTIYASTVNGSSHGYADNGHDYGSDTGYNGIINQSVHFGVGDYTETVTLYVNNDAAQEPDETFGFIVQSTNTDSNVDHYLAKSTFTIHDNDQISTAPDDYADDANDTSALIGSLNVGSPATGYIGAADGNDTYGDKDVFRVYLTHGHTYSFEMDSSANGGQALPLGIFTIRDGGNFDNVLATSAIGTDVTQIFSPTADGYYYVRVGTGGAPTDQGGYTISVSEITSPPTASDDYPDYPGDTTAVHGIPTVAMGGSGTGIIETVGDKDVFQINVQAGHTYQFSLSGETVGSNSALSSTYLTVRDGGNFDTILAQGGGGIGTTFSYTAQQTGIEYIRVGSGGNELAQGGYHLSITDKGVVSIPTDPPIDTATPATAVANWMDNRVFEYTSETIGSTENLWREVAHYIEDIPDIQDALPIAQHIADSLTLIGIAIDAGKIALDLSQSSDWRQTLFIDLGDWAIGQAISKGAGFLAGIALTGPGALISIPIISSGVQFVYDHAFANSVKQWLDIQYDGDDDSLWQIGKSSSSVLDGHNASDSSLSSSTSSPTVSLDGSQLILFDENFYLSTYADAAAAVANGTAGSAYAYFLTVGIDKGEQPNANQLITRADLPYSIVNNDPAALGNSALLTQQLGNYAGDGVSSAESAVVNAIDTAHGSSFALDGTLCAIASRKAIDLVANFAGSAVDSAHGKVNASWAAAWSNGNAQSQQFNAAFSEVFGADSTNSHYKMFVVASQNTDPAAILAQFEAQSGGNSALTGSQYDTIGIGEYGGIWVVIVGQHDAGYTPQTPGSDALTSITEYGGQGADTLYAGARTAHLYGMGGNDILVGGSGDDTLDGGDGNDTVSYAAATSGVYAELSYGGVQNTGGGQGSDTLTSIENVAGSEFDDTILDSSANNVISGNGGNDILSLWHGGTDTANGGAGNDSIFFGAALNAADRIDGGLGQDILSLQGDYSAGLMFVAATMKNIEMLTLNPGYSYKLTLNDANVAAGQTLTVNGISLGAGDTLNFSGAHETDGNFAIYAGAGNDILRGGGGSDYFDGGAGNDIFYLENGGNDRVSAGGDNDRIYFNASFNAADRIDGGSGTDSVYLDGDYSARVNFGASTMINVERLILAAGHTYDLNTNDATVASGQLLTVGGSALGATDRLIFNGSQETDGRFAITGGAGADVLTGGAGNDILNGGAGNDIFHLENGGNDGISAGADNDRIYFNASFNAADKIDGGGGTDSVYLDGDYSAKVNFGVSTMVNVERLSLTAGHTYNLATNDTTVASGQLFTVDGSALGATDRLIFNGSHETDGRFTVTGGAGADALTGGAGNDILNGGAGNDIFHLESGGNDGISAGADNDRIYFNASFNATDRIDGGSGTDSVYLDGDYSARVNFGVSTMANVERLTLAAGHTYNLNTNDTTVASGQLLTVDASALGDTDRLIFNGSHEADGRFTITGGAGADALTGGAGNDILNGGAGNDTLTGGAGDDKFVFAFGDGKDTVMDFVAGSAASDVIDLKNYGVTTFSALQGLISQHGADTVITFDADNQITLHNVQLAQLNAGDFLFH